MSSASWFEQSGNGQSDNTGRLQSDNVGNPKFDAPALIREGAGLSGLKGKGNSADQYLPPMTIHDADCPSDKPASGSKPGTQPVRETNPNETNGTKIERGSSGITSYSADGYSVAQHQDGKWYYHQDNKDGAKYVDVNNVQMDSNGKVTFHETGLFGKDGSIGGGEAPHETPTNGLAALQTVTDKAAHTVLGETVANAVGNTLVDAAHAGNATVERAAIGIDQLPTYFENRDGKINSAGESIRNDLGNRPLNWAEIWDGANVRLASPPDGGDFYKKWQNLPGAETAVSSHDSIGPQFRVKVGPGDATLLFGKGPDGNTFFQMERDGCGGNSSVLESASHLLDFATYEVTDSNVGPGGISPRTDKRPISG